MKRLNVIRNHVERDGAIAGHADGYAYQDKGGRLVCCCGYELNKQDEDTWRCDGGNHVYKLSDSSVVYDKFGRPMFKRPATT